MLIVCSACVGLAPASASNAVAATGGCARCGRPFHSLSQPALMSERPVTASARFERDVRAVRPLPLGSRERRGEASSSRVLVPVLACLALAIGGFATRDRIVAAVPGLKGAVAVLGLPFAPAGPSLFDVHSSLTQDETGKVLTLEGHIANQEGRSVAVPDLRIVVRDATSQDLYSWTTPPPRTRLAPGEDVAFRSRLVSPPEDGRDIVVSFAGDEADAKGAKVRTDP